MFCAPFQNILGWKVCETQLAEAHMQPGITRMSLVVIQYSHGTKILFNGSGCKSQVCLLGLISSRLVSMLSITYCYYSMMNKSFCMSEQEKLTKKEREEETNECLSTLNPALLFSLSPVPKVSLVEIHACN